MVVSVIIRRRDGVVAAATQQYGWVATLVYEGQRDNVVREHILAIDRLDAEKKAQERVAVLTG